MTAQDNSSSEANTSPGKSRVDRGALTMAQSLANEVPPTPQTDIDPMVKAAEQAVRMQRVTARLSEATTVHEVVTALLSEAQPIACSTGSSVHTVNERLQSLELVEQLGIENNDDDNFPLDARCPTTRCVVLGRPIIGPDSEKLNLEYPELEASFRESNIEALAAFPLKVSNVVIGVWTMVWDTPQDFQEGQIVILLTLASQCAQAIERAQLYERERITSRALQRTLLPEELPHVLGIATARRYQPWSKNVSVGGDWYDVLKLPRNHVLLVIGDVGGHNVVAAAVMGQLRNAIRSYAWEGHPVGKILEFTNSLLSEVEPGILTTCCIVDLGIDDGIATVAVAGHPPPLVVNAEGKATFMEVFANPPLGVGNDQVFGQSTLFLTAGESVALYTDGLVESRTLDLEEGMTRLESAVLSCPDTNDVELLSSTLMDAATKDRIVEDDMALLTLRYAPIGSQAAAQLPKRIRRTLTSSPTSASVARRFAADVVAGWGATDVVDSIELGVSELVTNALIHTASDVELILTNHTSNIEVEVVDRSDRMPAQRASEDTSDTTGRGLFIVETISSDWGVRPYDSGKSVWFKVERCNGGAPT